MKKLMVSFLVAVFTITAATAQYRDTRSGFDGDFFSLEGAIELFKNSRNLEEFERRLNSRDSWVNNLDLNYDGRTDYVRVEHQRQGDFHAIILQVPVSRYDVQDVAVIEIERTSSREALLQIVGDEYLYGDQVIAEPFDGNVRYDRGNGPNTYENYGRGYINVFYWPIVNSFFNNGYRVYVSPYRWSYYPTYWQPWRPCTWDVFRPRIVVFHRNYRVVNVHRVQRVHNFYKPNRRYCSNVFLRTNEVRVRKGKQPYYRANEPRYNGTNTRNSSPANGGNVYTRSNDRSIYKGTNSRMQSSDRGRDYTPRTSTSSRVNSGRDTHTSSDRVQSNHSRNNGKIERSSTSTQRGNTSTSKLGNSQGKKQASNVNRSSPQVSKNTSSKKSTSKSTGSSKKFTSRSY